ncbi:hypothetical protein Tco_0244041, partial [Tanacetum coccineum]
MEGCVQPKDQGGHGLKPLEMRNKTLLIKHLWNIAANKESLWVKWINTIKLKGRSVWDTQSYDSDSWCWKTILGLRKMVDKHIRYKVGNGFTDQSRLCDIVEDNRWKWPEEWVSKYDLLQRIPVPILKDIQDKALWVTNKGDMVQF